MDAALSELRTLAGADNATQRMGSELAAALRVVHRRLAQKGEPAADRLLDELRIFVAGGSAGTPALVSFARALAWAHRKHGNALLFDVAKSELDELRRFAQVAQNAAVDESLALSLRDAIWDHVYSKRALELASVVEELHSLVHGERAGPEHRARLAQALRDIHNGIVEKKIEGTAQDHLDRLVGLSKRPDAEVQTQEAAAHARRIAYEAALEAKKYGRANALLGELRASSEAAGASTYMKERYANALVDLTWDEGRRERWKPMRSPLTLLRTLWRTPSDARYRGYLVWGLRCAHGHLRWEGHPEDASALLEELRGLALPAKVESWEWRELAYALRDCVTYALAVPSTREDAEAPLSELSRIALTPSKDEGPRDHLSLALLRLCEWALRNNEAEQHAATLSQLRMLALRKQATPLQQQRLAGGLDGDASHALVQAVLAGLGLGKGGSERGAEENKALAASFRDRIQTDIDLVRVLAEQEQAAARTRELYAQILETGCRAAFGGDKPERGEAHLTALRTLATAAGATPEIRIAHVRGLEVALNSVVETGGPGAATALLDALAAYARTDGDTSKAAVHYGLALGTVASAYLEADENEKAEPLLRRLQELAKAQPKNMVRVL